MKITTVNGVEIDTESPEYQQYLRLSAIDDAHPGISDPAPYRTLGDVIELERWQRECEARDAADSLTMQPHRSFDRVS